MTHRRRKQLKSIHKNKKPSSKTSLPPHSQNEYLSIEEAKHFFNIKFEDGKQSEISPKNHEDYKKVEALKDAVVKQVKSSLPLDVMALKINNLETFESIHFKLTLQLVVYMFQTLDIQPSRELRQKLIVKACEQDLPFLLKFCVEQQYFPEIEDEIVPLISEKHSPLAYLTLYDTLHNQETHKLHLKDLFLKAIKDNYLSKDLSPVCSLELLSLAYYIGIEILDPKFVEQLKAPLYEHGQLATVILELGDIELAHRVLLEDDSLKSMLTTDDLIHITRKTISTKLLSLYQKKEILEPHLLLEYINTHLLDDFAKAILQIESPELVVYEQFETYTLSLLELAATELKDVNKNVLMFLCLLAIHRDNVNVLDSLHKKNPDLLLNILTSEVADNTPEIFRHVEQKTLLDAALASAAQRCLSFIYKINYDHKNSYLNVPKEQIADFVESVLTNDDCCSDEKILEDCLTTYGINGLEHKIISLLPRIGWDNEGNFRQELLDKTLKNDLLKLLAFPWVHHDIFQDIFTKNQQETFFIWLNAHDDLLTKKLEENPRTIQYDETTLEQETNEYSKTSYLLLMFELLIKHSKDPSELDKASTKLKRNLLITGTMNYSQRLFVIETFYHLLSLIKQHLPELNSKFKGNLAYFLININASARLNFYPKVPLNALIILEDYALRKKTMASLEEIIIIKYVHNRVISNAFITESGKTLLKEYVNDLHSLNITQQQHIIPKLLAALKEQDVSQALDHYIPKGSTINYFQIALYLNCKNVIDYNYFKTLSEELDFNGLHLLLDSTLFLPLAKQRSIHFYRFFSKQVDHDFLIQELKNNQNPLEKRLLIESIINSIAEEPLILLKDPSISKFIFKHDKAFESLASLYRIQFFENELIENITKYEAYHQDPVLQHLAICIFLNSPTLSLNPKTLANFLTYSCQYSMVPFIQYCSRVKMGNNVIRHLQLTSGNHIPIAQITVVGNNKDSLGLRLKDFIEDSDLYLSDQQAFELLTFSYNWYEDEQIKLFIHTKLIHQLSGKDLTTLVTSQKTPIPLLYFIRHHKEIFSSLNIDPEQQTIIIERLIKHCLSAGFDMIITFLTTSFPHMQDVMLTEICKHIEMLSYTSTYNGLLTEHKLSYLGSSILKILDAGEVNKKPVHENFSIIKALILEGYMPLVLNNQTHDNNYLHHYFDNNELEQIMWRDIYDDSPSIFYSMERSTLKYALSKGQRYLSIWLFQIAYKRSKANDLNQTSVLNIHPYELDLLKYLVDSNAPFDIIHYFLIMYPEISLHSDDFTWLLNKIIQENNVEGLEVLFKLNNAPILFHYDLAIRHVASKTTAKLLPELEDFIKQYQEFNKEPLIPQWFHEYKKVLHDQKKNVSICIALVGNVVGERVQSSVLESGEITSRKVINEINEIILTNQVAQFFQQDAMADFALIELAKNILTSYNTHRLSTNDSSSNDLAPPKLLSKWQFPNTVFELYINLWHSFISLFQKMPTIDDTFFHTSAQTSYLLESGIQYKFNRLNNDILYFLLSSPILPPGQFLSKSSFTSHDFMHHKIMNIFIRRILSLSADTLQKFPIIPYYASASSSQLLKYCNVLGRVYTQKWLKCHYDENKINVNSLQELNKLASVFCIDTTHRQILWAQLISLYLPYIQDTLDHELQKEFLILLESIIKNNEPLNFKLFDEELLDNKNIQQAIIFILKHVEQSSPFVYLIKSYLLKLYSDDRTKEKCTRLISHLDESSRQKLYENAIDNKNLRNIFLFDQEKLQEELEEFGKSSILLEQRLKEVAIDAIEHHEMLTTTQNYLESIKAEASILRKKSDQLAQKLAGKTTSLQSINKRLESISTTYQTHQNVLRKLDQALHHYDNIEKIYDRLNTLVLSPNEASLDELHSLTNQIKTTKNTLDKILSKVSKKHAKFADKKKTLQQDYDNALEKIEKVKTSLKKINRREQQTQLCKKIQEDIVVITDKINACSIVKVTNKDQLKAIASQLDAYTNQLSQLKLQTEKLDPDYLNTLMTLLNIPQKKLSELKEQTAYIKVQLEEFLEKFDTLKSLKTLILNKIEEYLTNLKDPTLILEAIKAIFSKKKFEINELATSFDTQLKQLKDCAAKISKYALSASFIKELQDLSVDKQNILASFTQQADMLEEQLTWLGNSITKTRELLTNTEWLLQRCSSLTLQDIEEIQGQLKTFYQNMETFQQNKNDWSTSIESNIKEHLVDIHAYKIFQELDIKLKSKLQNLPTLNAIEIIKLYLIDRQNINELTSNIALLLNKCDLLFSVENLQDQSAKVNYTSPPSSLLKQDIESINILQKKAEALIVQLGKSNPQLIEDTFPYYVSFKPPLKCLKETLSENLDCLQKNRSIFDFLISVNECIEILSSHDKIEIPDKNIILIPDELRSHFKFYNIFCGGKLAQNHLNNFSIETLIVIQNRLENKITRFHEIFQEYISPIHAFIERHFKNDPDKYEQAQNMIKALEQRHSAYSSLLHLTAIMVKDRKANLYQAIYDQHALELSINPEKYQLNSLGWKASFPTHGFFAPVKAEPWKLTLPGAKLIESEIYPGYLEVQWPCAAQISYLAEEKDGGYVPLKSGEMITTINENLEANEFCYIYPNKQGLWTILQNGKVHENINIFNIFGNKVIHWLHFFREVNELYVIADTYSCPLPDEMKPVYTTKLTA